MTINGAITSAEQSRLNELRAIADQSSHVSMVAWWAENGQPRGYRYVGSGSFAPDKADEANISQADLVSRAGSAPVTFTLVVNGTQRRIGVDINNNGLLDGDELPAVGGGCVDGLFVEAEDGVLSGLMSVGSDSSASGGSFVEVPEGSGNSWAFGSDSRVELCFDVAEAGRYRIETRAWAEVGANSMFVTVDGVPVDGFLWDVRRAGGFAVDDVSDRGEADPVVVDLGVGEHSVVFYHRKDGTRLDNVTLVRVGDIGVGGGCVDGLFVEAEDGVLSGLMSVGSDSSASGGSFVEVPEGSGNSWAFGSDSRVELCFDVAEAGRYRIETRAWAEVGANSMFVTVDGVPVDGFLWDVRRAGGFAVDDVSDRGEADPVVVDLGVGEHSVVFYHRKDGTRLDNVTLVQVE